MSLQAADSLLRDTYNRIALLTGTLVDRLKAELSEDWRALELPSPLALVWTPSLIEWARDQIEVIERALGRIAEGLTEWREGVAEIVVSAASGGLPMPRELGYRVMRCDDGARAVIMELLSVARAISTADRRDLEAQVLELMQPSISEPPTGAPSIAQRFWRSAVAVFVAAAVVWTPAAVAWAAGVYYVALWKGARSELPALPQDSRRVVVPSDGKPNRKRQNQRPGPDL